MDLCAKDAKEELNIQSFKYSPILNSEASHSGRERLVSMEPLVYMDWIVCIDKVTAARIIYSRYPWLHHSRQ